MVILISGLLILLTSLLFIPVCVFAIECLMAVLYSDAAKHSRGISDRKICTIIVIPAHNEEGGIEKTLSAMTPDLSSQDRVLVVADNCTDSTANVATRCGAIVLKRDDKEHRGKGYALDFAVQYLQHNPPDVVIFVDADCHLSSGAVKLLGDLAYANKRPVQSCYEVNEASPIRKTGTNIATFAWLVRGRVRPIGLAAMGMPCQLYGTGMAFPWAILQGLSLASSNIVEDMKITLDLIEKGTMPMFCSNASVASTFPSTNDAADAQRRRWEHGHLATIFKYGIPAVAKGMMGLNMQKTMLALDICVPPLALLFILLVMGSMASVLAIPMVDAARYTTGFFLVAWIMFGASLSMAWSRFGREVVTFKTVLGIPAYVVSKLPLYLKFLTDRQKEWNRTDRK